ncbi:MAG: alpha/beta hydrolase [Pseudomonadota bacterium]|nr:alpha/beta hydrolase [Pseudomonadota bacterium]
MRVDDREIGLVDRGEGPPVVLVHSSGLSAQQWGPIVPRLAERHRVLAPDLLGYGKSAPWPDPDRFDLAADLAIVRAVIESAGTPVHLVGHSYGGVLAMRAAMDLPAHVRSLAVYEPVAFHVLVGRDPDAEADLARVDDGTLLDARTGGDLAWVEKFIDYWGGDGAWARLHPTRQAALLAVGRKAFLEVRSLMELKLAAEDWRIATPTLVMAGTRSPSAARSVCRVLAESLPDARLEVFEGAGHMAPVEEARRFWTVLDAWLTEQA